VTATTLPTESLKKIQALLDPNAKLLLFGCISGAEAPGTKLLIGISKLLPGHDVVGFDAQNTPELPLGTLQREGGFLSSKQVFDPFVKTFRPFKTDHGWIQFRTESDVNGFMHQFPALFDKANLKVDATETAETAKVARDGKVIRWPIDEAPPAVPTEQKKRK
jgi:hypothetical protein